MATSTNLNLLPKTHWAAASKNGVRTLGMYAVAAMVVSARAAALVPISLATRAPRRPAATVSCLFPKDGHVPSSRRRVPPSPLGPRRRFAAAGNGDEGLAAGEGCGCDVPATRPAATWGGPDADARSLGRRLRDAVLTDVAGEAVQLGTYLGGAADDATIVVFLRHLA